MNRLSERGELHIERIPKILKIPLSIPQSTDSMCVRTLTTAEERTPPNNYRELYPALKWGPGIKLLLLIIHRTLGSITLPKWWGLIIPRLAS